jgi:hypothetical protein
VRGQLHHQSARRLTPARLSAARILCLHHRRGLRGNRLLLIQEMPGGGTRVAYDTVASAIAPYHDAAASEVTERLDTEVLRLLRQVTRAPASVTA